jgi:MFS family permease
MKGLGSLFRNRRWALAMCGQAIYNIPFSVVVVFGGLLGQSLYHASPSMTQASITGFFVVSFLCRAALVRHPSVAHRVRFFGVSVISTVLGLALLASGSHVAAFVLALAVLGATHGLNYPLALGLVAESVSAKALSQANAGFTAVSNMINVVAPLILGVVIDHYGDRTMLYCAAVPVALLAGLLWRLRDASTMGNTAQPQSVVT